MAAAYGADVFAAILVRRARVYDLDGAVGRAPRHLGRRCGKRGDRRELERDRRQVRILGRNRPPGAAPSLDPVMINV
jgi:hypothetical protein